MKKSAIEMGMLAMLLGLPAARAADLPEPQSPGAALITGYCTQCHGAPAPSAHSAREWPSVVFRMQNWRITKGFGEIPPKDLAPLIAYLKRHGSPE